MRGSATRRVLLIAPLLAVALLVAQPTPADAHTRTEETTNVDSRLIAAPDVPGVVWTVHTGGLVIEVENRGGAILEILGYEGEPYLRITAAGVERNRLSPATYLSAERFGDVAVPPIADASAEPEWVRIGDEPRHVWHDHRTHWMSPAPPPFVYASAPARAGMRAGIVGAIGRAGDDAGIFHEWVVPVLVDGRPAEVRGELVWVDPPSAVPWFAIAALLVSPALLGLRRGDRAGLVRPAALVIAVVALGNTIHLVDDLVAWPTDLLDELFGVLHTTTFLTTGIGASVWAWRATAARVLMLAIGSGAVLYHQGLVHLPMLFASQFPTVWPDAVVRLTIALGLVQAVPVAVVVVRAVRGSVPDASVSCRTESSSNAPAVSGGA
jgi:hypothetical protein